jgi:hypothetical protein
MKRRSAFAVRQRGRLDIHAGISILQIGVGAHPSALGLVRLESKHGDSTSDWIDQRMHAVSRSDIHEAYRFISEETQDI